MRYLSVCSGIEAATVAWHQLGWEAEAYSEIEKFPSAVLAHHYPGTPNLGDMTKFKEWNIGKIDMLVGGTPCQSFSVAGLRKGLDDPRGNLCLVYLAIAERFRPSWVVWENVPGVLSDKTNAFGNMLDSFGELGYIVDTEILDAKFFGVPQRRRRVFICAQSREDFLSRRTATSALTIVQFLAETLHGLLAGVLYQSEKERIKSALPYLSSDGVRKRIELFWPATDMFSFGMLLKHLVEAWRRCHLGAGNSEYLDGGLDAEHMLAALLMASPEVPQNILTEELLKKNLVGVYKVMRLCITSTSENPITPQAICMCMRAVQTMSALTCLLPPSSPTFWSADLSVSTLLQELTNYVKRQANDEVSAKALGFCSWSDLIAQTKFTDLLVGYLGDWRRAAAVLFERHSLSGNPPPSREKREEIAGDVADCLRSGGDGGVPSSRGEHLVYGIDEECNAAEGVFGPLLRGGQGGTRQAVCYDTTIITSPQNGSNPSPGDPMYTLAKGQHPPLMVLASGQGGAELCSDGSPSLTCNHEAPIVFEPGIAKREGNPARFSVDISPTLRSEMGDNQPAVAFSNASDGSSIRNATDITDPITCRHGDPGMIQKGMQVRRLTPVECERLQGFPDNYTNIPWRGKAEAPDGLRYKALGNSMAVPCMRWLGDRIQEVGKE